MNVAPREIEIEAGAPGLMVAGRDSVPAIMAGVLTTDTTLQVHKMFRDPRVLEPAQRAELISELRRSVELNPGFAELRVLLGMALCVDLQAQQAMEEFRLAVEQAPDSFIARLKYGELLMRLRICRRAAEETHRAAQLAANAAQSEMARRQAASIRTMLREGIERGGHPGLLARIFHWSRRPVQQKSLQALVGTE